MKTKLVKVILNIEFPININNTITADVEVLIEITPNEKGEMDFNLDDDCRDLDFRDLLSNVKHLGLPVEDVNQLIDSYREKGIALEDLLENTIDLAVQNLKQDDFTFLKDWLNWESFKLKTGTDSPIPTTTIQSSHRDLETLTPAELEYLEHLLEQRIRYSNNGTSLFYPEHCQREVAIELEKSIHEKLKTKKVKPGHQIISLPYDYLIYLSKLLFNRTNRPQLYSPMYPKDYINEEAYQYESNILEILNNTQGIK